MRTISVLAVTAAALVVFASAATKNRINPETDRGAPRPVPQDETATRPQTSTTARGTTAGRGKTPDDLTNRFLIEAAGRASYDCPIGESRGTDGQCRSSSPVFADNDGEYEY